MLLAGHEEERMSQDSQPDKTLTIGQLAQLTGIGQHTLRVWERRYDALKVLRLPSGHRRYPHGEVKRLRAVATAIEKGFRTRKVVNNSLDELENLLNPAAANQSTDETDHPDSTLRDTPLILEWVTASRHYDEGYLTAQFYHEWGLRGPLPFLSELAVPFLKEVGQQWEDGDLTISQEHFASEALSDFMGGQWRKLNERNVGGSFVLTTLPDEQHRVGIQMCALITALVGRRVVYLGKNTPVVDSVSAVSRSTSQALGISISISYPVKDALKWILELRKELPEKAHLIIGGAGVGNIPEKKIPEGVSAFTSMEDYFLWLNNSSGTLKC